MAQRHLLPPVSILAAVALLAPLAAGKAWHGYPWPVCGYSNSFTANGTFQAHLNLVAATLPRNASASPDLFATAVVGAVPEQLWAMGLCRADVNATTCFNCLTQAFIDLPNYCSYDKDATIYYDFCMLHYSDVHTRADDDTDPLDNIHSVYNLGNVTADTARFNRLLATLVNATADYAAYNSTRRFATGDADFDHNYPKVYSLAQCTPDLAPSQCRKCLFFIITQSLPVFMNHIGGRVLWVNCVYRFETAPFYNGPAMVRLASPSSSGAPALAPSPSVHQTSGMQAAAGGGGRNYNVTVVVFAVVLPTLAVLNLVACFCFWWRRPPAQKKQPYPVISMEAEDIEMVDSIMIDVSTLRAATGDFAESNKLWCVLELFQIHFRILAGLLTK